MRAFLAREILTHWKCAIIWKRTNIKQNKVRQRRNVLPDALGRKPNCTDPDAATIGYNKGSKRPKQRPWWCYEHHECCWRTARNSASWLGCLFPHHRGGFIPVEVISSLWTDCTSYSPTCPLRVFVISQVPRPQYYFELCGGVKCLTLHKKLNSLM